LRLFVRGGHDIEGQIKVNLFSALCVRYVDGENPFLTSRLMTPFVTGGAPTRRKRYGARLPTAFAACQLVLRPGRQEMKCANRRGDFLEPIVRFYRLQFLGEEDDVAGRIHVHSFMPAASQRR
jgi:hypothetical protein